MIEKTPRIVIVLITSTLLVVSVLACSAAKTFSRAAEQAKLEREDIMVAQLPLVIFRNEKMPHSSTIHFYFDGDGMPWINGKRIAADPTSRSQVILELMSKDIAAKILVGRPCYYIAIDQRPSSCTSSLWTSHRYSDEVISPMVEVIKNQIARFKPKNIVFIGYSGGGTLAMLIAHQLTQVNTIITIAANLDVDAWLARHQFSPLARSLNANNFPLLSDKIRQWHFVGGQDKNVPAEITRLVAGRQPGAKLIVEHGYGHECCWPEDWASRLATVFSDAEF